MSFSSVFKVLVAVGLLVSLSAQAAEPTAQTCDLQRKIEADPNGLTAGNLKSVALYSESLADNEATKSGFFMVAELGRPNGKLKVINRATGEVKVFPMQGPDASNKPYGATALDLEGGSAKADVLSATLSARIGKTLPFQACTSKSRKTESADTSSTEQLCLKNEKDVAALEKMLAGQKTLMVLLPSKAETSESFAIDLRKRLFPRPHSATVCSSLLSPAMNKSHSLQPSGGASGTEDAVQ